MKKNSLSACWYYHRTWHDWSGMHNFIRRDVFGLCENPTYKVLNRWRSLKAGCSAPFLHAVCVCVTKFSAGCHGVIWQAGVLVVSCWGLRCSDCLARPGTGVAAAACLLSLPHHLQTRWVTFAFTFIRFGGTSTQSEQLGVNRLAQGPNGGFLAIFKLLIF